MSITIKARNVAEAWDVFRMYAQRSEFMRTVSPRGLATKEFLEPVLTTYTHPEECVLLDPVRDANPFFHLYEALWMLSGKRDVRRLAYYVPSIAQFSDDGINFFGAYGYRLRTDTGTDQLQEAVQLLRKDPDSRRAVLGLWRPSDWLSAATTKDLPCNTTAYVKIRDGKVHLTVCNRSNDAVWGCYGANAVQFSFLLQYLAAALGVAVGSYHQFSDSLHVYLSGPAASTWERCRAEPTTLLQDYSYEAQGLLAVPLVSDVRAFDEELALLLGPGDGTPQMVYCTEPFLREVAYPMLRAFSMYRKDRLADATEFLARLTQNMSRPEAWLTAGYLWLLRRAS